MAKNEKTSSDVAKIASKGLRAPSTLSTKEIKAVSASALTQKPDRKSASKPAAKGKK